MGHAYRERDGGGAAAGAVALQHAAPQTVLAVSAAACTAAGMLAVLHRDLRRSH
jgi:predicted MFS family arabinose efflux permease